MRSIKMTEIPAECDFAGCVDPNCTRMHRASWSVEISEVGKGRIMVEFSTFIEAHNAWMTTVNTWYKEKDEVR